MFICSTHALNLTSGIDARRYIDVLVPDVERLSIVRVARLGKTLPAGVLLLFDSVIDYLSLFQVIKVLLFLGLIDEGQLHLNGLFLFLFWLLLLLFV